MAEDACVLDPQQRGLVEKTVREHCEIRGWTLHAVNCRTNHLHVVVTANRHPDEVREQLKAWCTRKLKALARARQETPAGRQRALSNSADGDGQIREHWWAERGSKRYLNDADSLEAAVLYVRDGQDRRP